MMSLARQVFAVTLLLQSSFALIEFEKSKLYDEFDFAVQVINIPNNFCDVGCRIYASVPESSAEIAKQISVHDYAQASENLYDISKLKKGDQKGYFEVEKGNVVVDIINTNPGNGTAPIAVWVLRGDAYNIGYAMVFDAIDISYPDSVDWATIMSVEPYTLRSKTVGPMCLVSTLTGFDAITNANDGCTYVLAQMNPDALSDVVISVQSPLISLNFDDVDYPFSTVSLSVDVGNDDLDFSGISYAASPGYIGCKGGKTFRSSMYPASTTFEYSKSDRLYDVYIASVKNTDDAHPVAISGNSNGNNWSGTVSDGSKKKDLTLEQINDLKISWTRDENQPDQSFLVRINPYNEQIHTTNAPVTTPETTTTAEPERTTESEPERITTEAVLTTKVHTPTRKPTPTTTTEVTVVETTTTTTTSPTTTTQPIDHSSCPAGFELVRNGECRGSAGKASSYNDAAFNDVVQMCQEVNGQPIIIHDDDHQNYWKNWKEQDGTVQYKEWPIGLTCNAKSKKWEWADGSRVDYKPTARNYDSDLTKKCKEGCGWFMNTAGYWKIRCNHDSFVSNVFCTTQLQQPSTKCSSGPWKEGEMIYSPGFPYHASTPCDFVFKVDAGKRVELTVVSLEANSCCDLLVLSEDGNRESYKVKLTGDVHDKTYTTKSSNQMKVSWQPKGGVNVRGVQMKFRAV